MNTSVNRHKTREGSFLLIFQKSLNNNSNEEIIELTQDADFFIVTEEMKKNLNEFYKNKNIIDEVIENNLKNWSKNRIPKVCLAILRLSIYEMIFCEDVPNDVAISEAIKLGEDYLINKDDVSFMNGVLSSANKSLENK